MKKLSIKELVIYEDNNYLALNKPPQFYTINDRNNSQNSLLSLLKNEYEEEVYLCHRLDFDTSGVVIFAKSKASHKSLNFQFARRKVFKLYYAVMSGVHSFENEVIKAPLIFKKDKAKIDHRKGKSSITIFNTKKVYDDFTLVECQTLTGRTHQIRVHANYRKASLVGDLKYRGNEIFLSELKKNYKKKEQSSELPIIQRAALHALKIEFQDLDGNKVSIEAPLPHDFKLLLKYLDSFAANNLKKVNA